MTHKLLQESYTIDELAERFEISRGSLIANRGMENQIPWRKFGRTVRYLHDDLVDWLGYDDIRLYSTKSLAKIYTLSEVWLKRNRSGASPMPFKNIGVRIIRYHLQAVEDWLASQRKANKLSIVKVIGQTNSGLIYTP